MRSLSRILLIALLTVVLLGGAISGWLAYRSGLIEVAELFDAKLAHSARVLRGLVDSSLDETQEIPLPIEIAVWAGDSRGHGADLATTEGHAYETKLAFQVWSADGRLLLRSDNSPATALAPLRRGFHDVLIESQHWRSFALRAESGRWYLAGEREDVRGEISADIATGILLPLVIELPVLGLLIWLIIGSGERSLRRVIVAIEQRAVGRLQPIQAEGVPSEIVGLVTAINRLLAALDAALQHERRFTADAAHELRTPLTALRLQLANLQAAQDPSARETAERQLERGLLRLDRLVAQLLSLSRIEPDAAIPLKQAIDLAALLREVSAELLNSGLGKQIDIELRCEEALPPIQGEALSLGMLLRNLLDNALRYTPAGGRVRVSLRRSGAATELLVEDSGPGIPAEARERVLQRFHRELGSEVEGSGLGLSIVQRVAAIHHAELQLEHAPELGGLRVCVRFPDSR